MPRSITNLVLFATTPHPVGTSGARVLARRAPPPSHGGDQTHARASTRTARRTLAARRRSMVVQTVRHRPPSTVSTSGGRAASASCVPVPERSHGRPDAARDGPRGTPKAGPDGGEWLFQTRHPPMHPAMATRAPFPRRSTPPRRSRWRPVAVLPNQSDLRKYPARIPMRRVPRGTRYSHQTHTPARAPVVHVRHQDVYANSSGYAVAAVGHW